MKAYKREDFIKLPQGTIYSYIEQRSGNLFDGLFCKMSSGIEYENDFVEQDLISEVGYPNDIKDGCEAWLYQENLRDTFKDFKTDLYCCGRDGLYDERLFIVWDKEDITKLRDYLNSVL